SPFKKPILFRGRPIPGRRFTIFSLLYFTVFVAVPILAFTAGLDLLGWLVMTKVFNSSCYGILCLF
ncbi:MAG: hypothetical protein VX049_11380, partial [Pseudomonadota bacterium]|nr:hypothetical protein [Pseudomonadota bacterium]